jgi:predicted nucleic acid-binding protein
VKSSVFVVNASPLITLGRLMRLDLLPQLADAVVVPRGVLDEVAAKLDEHRLAEVVERQPGFSIVPDVPLPLSLSD